LDFKNVVYDALNVFSALLIVNKFQHKVSLAEEGLKYLNQETGTTPKVQNIPQVPKKIILPPHKANPLKEKLEVWIV